MVRSLALPRFLTNFSLVLLLGLWPMASRAQEISTELAQPQYSNGRSGSAASSSSSSTHTMPDPADLELSWRNMPTRFFHNEKDMWPFTAKLGAEKLWIPTATMAGGTALFIKEDPPLERKVRQIATFEPDARGEDSAEQGATGSSPQPQVQPQKSNHEGLIMRSVKRTLEDQKELYRAPFKLSNLKWDALVLGGTGALLATDRHIEKHIGNAHYTFYQATSNVAIAGLGATLGGVWIWGIKADHPHAKETGALELETLVNTFLIYTPMQLVAARQRPGEGNGNGDFWKHHNINTSFPGGHAMFTFAMATVVSHEYSQKWVQVLAYSAATVVTVSRFMARDHWASDMFIGSALGIGIGAHIFHAHCNPELSDSCKHHVRWIF